MSPLSHAGDVSNQGVYLPSYPLVRLPQDPLGIRVDPKRAQNNVYTLLDTADWDLPLPRPHFSASDSIVPIVQGR